MTEREAAEVVATLVNAYPRQVIEQPTFDLYVGKLRPLDAELARRAADDAILACRAFPTLAEFFTRYETVRQQARRDALERQKRRDWEAMNVPKVPLNEIPAVVEYLGRPQEHFGLQESDPGRCDDCRRDVLRRWRVGDFTVCGDDARARVRAGFKAEQPLPEYEPAVAGATDA